MPEFTNGCPRHQYVIADKRKTEKIVSWPAIKAEDNDGYVPDMKVTPQEISPFDTSYKFSRGTHVVTFTARDQSGNSRSCSFRVEVKGSRCRLFTSVATVLFCLPSRVPSFCDSFFFTHIRRGGLHGKALKWGELPQDESRIRIRKRRRNMWNRSGNTTVNAWFRSRFDDY